LPRRWMLGAIGVMTLAGGISGKAAGETAIGAMAMSGQAVVIGATHVRIPFLGKITAGQRSRIR